MQSTEDLSTARIHDTPSQRGEDRWLVQGTFFAGFLAYVWFLIRPRLIYDAFGIYLPYPEFSTDGACLREAFSHAAGPLEYVAAFLSQWFSAAPLGALIVTAAAGLICLGTERLIRGMGRTYAWFPSLLPALAVLSVYQTYHHPLAALLALASCLWLAVAYQTTGNSRRADGRDRATTEPASEGNPNLERGNGPRRPWLAFRACVGISSLTRRVSVAAWRPVVFLVMCLGLYYLAGTVCLLFGLLVGTWYASAQCRVIAGAGAAVASAVVPWLAGTWLFYMTVVEAYCVAWPFGSGSASDMESWPLNVLRGLFLFPLGMLLVAALCRVLPRAVQDRFLGFPWRGGRTLRVVSELVVLAAAFAAVHQFLRAPHREKRFEMVHFTHQRQWDQVLNAARQVPPSSHDCFSRHLVNRALYHTGRLGDELFSFSQDPAGLLLLTDEVPHGAPKFWMLSEIGWELGDVNLAEQWTFERLEAVGECPSALETLAMVCLAKGRTDETSYVDESLQDSQRVSERLAYVSSPGREAARVVLNRMTKNVIQGRRAQTLLGLLDEASPAGDSWLEEIERVRALRCTVDRVYQTDSEEAVLRDLLQANPRNQMAFEYLMAYYLIIRRTDQLVANLHRLDDFGCREIPRHYEEALLIHANETAQPIDLHGRKIRRETSQRFRAFLDRVRPLQNQPQLALSSLAGEFGDSYFYYYAFGVSGTGGAR